MTRSRDDVAAPSGAARSVLFLMASARSDGNAEQLARHASRALPPDTKTTWLRLADYPLPAFEDLRHGTDRTYGAPEGAASVLMEATLEATDLVFVAPVYWYGPPADLKLYLDHWSGWLRAPHVDFRARMAGRAAWAISVYSDQDPRLAQPLFDTLRFTAEYMGMTWSGALLGHGNRPGDILADAQALAAADQLFAAPE